MLFFVGDALRLERIGFVTQLDNIMYDARLAMTMPRGRDNRIVILDIDEKSLGEIGRWWSPSHTFSRDAANLSLELRAGGCFCERLKDGGSVQHLQVVYAAPGEGLRLRGALGPLQVEGVDGTLSWTLKPAEGGTSLTQSYVVGGYIRSGMEQWAPKVDRVLEEQLQRLKSFVEEKSPVR